MPEYLAPGVYIEEVSFRSKSIEGVSTTTTAFVGPTRYGPTNITPDVITSLVEYERIYGDRQQLEFGDGGIRHNYMWHAVRAFYENGGKRLYIARTYNPLTTTALAGHATGGSANTLNVRARFPGSAGNMRVRITLQAGANVLDGTNTAPVVRGLSDFDLVLVAADNTASIPTAPSTSLAAIDALWAIATRELVNGQQVWRFRRAGTTTPVELTTLQPETGGFVRIVTATVTIVPADPSMPTSVYADLALDSRHRRNGADDSLAGQFAVAQASLSRARTVPIVMSPAAGNGITIADDIITLAANDVDVALFDNTATDAERSFDFALLGGNDGNLPAPSHYEGEDSADPLSRVKSGLKSLEDIDDISIVAAPGSTFGYTGNEANALSIAGAVISHCERMRYRIGVLDSGNDLGVGEVRAMRGKMDSSYAALYYPWYTIVDPVTREEINVPPSGAVAGIYARNDIERAVYKAPANEVIDTAIGLETILNKSQQDVLNPLGVNCLRFFEGRGFRVWGARTISSDPEWKYVNLRRYFAYLEHSIDKGTQWAVFEPNGSILWANVRSTISDFLLNEFQNGALLGDKPEQAYFVKCDRSTMTQNDLDNGRLVCLVGVAALRPAEFVIIRIGQWTADRKV